MDTSFTQSPTLIAGFIFLTFVGLAAFIRRRQRDEQLRKNGYGTLKRVRILEPFLGLDYVIKIFDNVSLTQRNRNQYGKTYAVEPLLREPTIVTSEPENIKRIFSSVDNDLTVSWRREAVEPFTGRGVLTEDGEGWKHPRKMLRPVFAKNNIADLEHYAQVMNKMMEQIPGGGETVDIQPLLLKAFMENALYFVVGYDAQNPNPKAPLSCDEFLSLWLDGMQGIALRLLFGTLSRVIPNKKFDRACKEVANFVDFHIDQAVENDNTKKESQIWGESLLAQVDDRIEIRNMLIQGIIGAQDTTSVLTSNTIHLLARYPALWKELREEVLKHGNDMFTFDALRSNEVIQNMLSESLRIYPIFPELDRMSIRDTTLPTGGGPDGTSKVFVKAGTRVSPYFYPLHREPSVFGPDVEAFNPHRWKTIKPTQWEYFPFGGGPRNCMGREKSLVEAAWLLAKLASRFETLESRDERPWTGMLTFTCANKYGCSVAFNEKA